MSVTELSLAEQLVLRALGEPGTRWHEFHTLAADTGLAPRAASSAMSGLRRRGLAVRRAALGPQAQDWSITGLGIATLDVLAAEERRG